MFKWFDKLKQKDNAFIDFAKFAYSIGKSEIVSPIIQAILVLIIPILVSNKEYGWSIACGAFYVLTLVFSSICIKYSNRNFERRKFSSELLKEHSSTIKSLGIEMETQANWRNKVFKTISQLICVKTKNVFKNVFKCETRVSVEYTYKSTDSDGKEVTFVKMAGRESANRNIPRNAKPLEEKKLYFSYSIFNNNKEGLNVVHKDDFKKPSIWYYNEAHKTELDMYIGIAVSASDNSNVDFIYQIDFFEIPEVLNKKTDPEIKDFVNRYLISYINTLCLAYLLNLDDNHNIHEV